MNVAQPKNLGILVLIVALLAGCAQSPSSSVQRASHEQPPLTGAALPQPWHDVYSATAAYAECSESRDKSYGSSTFGNHYTAPPANELANASTFRVTVSWNLTALQPIHFWLGTVGQTINGTSSTSPLSIDVPASTIHPLANYLFVACPQGPLVNGMGGVFVLQDVAADVSYS
jgi:hypothetical protein